MRSRFVKIESYRLAVACEAVAENLAVHHLSADDYRLAGVVLDFGSWLCGAGGALSRSKRQKACDAKHYDKSLAIRHISIPWFGRSHSASRIWEVRGGERVGHPDRHLSSIPAGRQFSFWLGSLEDC